MSAPTAAVDPDIAFRETLDAIPANQAHYGSWWGTALGQELYAAIAERIAAPLSRKMAADHGSRYEASDIINTAVEVLNQDFTVKAVGKAENPWGYLYTVLHNEVRKQIGWGDSLDAFERAVDLAVNDEQLYTPVTVAAELTADSLARFSPRSVHEALPEAVLYFAERGHTRLSHLYTNSTRDNELIRLGLNRGEILAIANAVLGSRRGGGETSILAGYLVDETWKPEQSPVHRAVLQSYRTRMTREHLRSATGKAS